MPLYFKDINKANRQFPYYTWDKIRDSFEKGEGFVQFQTFQIPKTIKSIRNFLSDHEMVVELWIDPNQIALLPELETYIENNFELKLGDSKMLKEINFFQHESLQVPLEKMLESNREKRFSADFDDTILTNRNLAEYIAAYKGTPASLCSQIQSVKSMSDLMLAKRSNADYFACLQEKDAPKRKWDKLFAMAVCLGLHLNLEQCKALMKFSEGSFQNQSKQDLIFQFFVSEGVYDPDTINLALFRHDQRQIYWGAV